MDGGARSSDRLRTAAKGLVVLRLALALVAIAAVLIGQARAPDFSIEYFLGTRAGAIYVLAVAACLVNIPYLLILRLTGGRRPPRGGRRPPHGGDRAARLCVWTQIALDLVLVAGLAWYDRGVSSPFAGLMFVPILASAWCLTPRATLAVALGGAGLLSLVAGLHARAFVPGTTPVPTGLGTEGAHFVQTSAFFLVALLAAELSRRIRSARVLADDVIASFTDGLVVLDRSLRVVLANESARHLLGVALEPGAPAREELARPEHRPLLDLLQERRSAASVQIALPRPSRGGRAEVGVDGPQPERGPPRGVPPPREPRPVAVRIVPVRGGGAELVGALLVTLADRTLERRVERSERLAERSRTVSELAASIAHEVRNPLASVRGAVQEIVRGTRLGEREQELAGIVLAESDRLDRMVGEFLQFARLRPAHRVSLALAPILAEVRSLLAARAPGARLEVDAPDSLHCLADAGQLRQVLLNLGVNAVEAGEANGTGAGADRTPVRGGAAHPVRLSARPCARGQFLSESETALLTEESGAEEGVVIQVADSGCGMDGQVRARALEPFFTTKTGGTGLGLAVVDRIVRAHEGELMIESVRGAGARIRLWLPRAEAPAERSAREGLAPGAQGAARLGRKEPA